MMTMAPITSDRAEKRESLPFVAVDGPPPSRARAQTSPGGELPFKPSTPGELPAHLAAFDLAKHAALTAVLGAFPQHHAQVFAQYGLAGPAERELLDRHWLKKLADDPKLAAQWVELRNRAAQYYRGSST